MSWEAESTGGAAASPPGPIRLSLPMLTLVPHGMGGTETYCRELVSRFVADDRLEVVAFTSRHAEGVLTPTGARAVTVTQVKGGESSRERLQAMARALLSRRARQMVVDRADVVHYLFTVPVPVVRGVPHVVTLHDVQHLDLPDFFPPAERALRRLTYDRAARRADAVITLSEFCRQRIIDRLGVSPERVHVAHLGVGDHFRPPEDREAVSSDYVLYPARRFPHKNHQRLIEAMELVRRERPELRLILTGGGPPVGGAPAWVEQRGEVPVDALVGLYQNAACMAFPSLYEGFGMPPLEAMACGTPVASSTAGALPEVCGDAAVMFDPLDVPGMAAAILSASANRSVLARQGLERAGKFTWEACAELHVDVYRDLVRERVSR